MVGDGQVSLGQTVMKHSARKVRKLYHDKVIAGFAGATADAFTLFEKFEAKLEQFNGNLKRAAVELAKDWRTDRVLRRLEALLIVADAADTLVVSGAATKTAELWRHSVTTAVAAQLMAKDGEYAQVRLPSGEIRISEPLDSIERDAANTDRIASGTIVQGALRLSRIVRQTTTYRVRGPAKEPRQLAGPKPAEAQSRTAGADGGQQRLGTRRHQHED